MKLFLIIGLSVGAFLYYDLQREWSDEEKNKQIKSAIDVFYQPEVKKATKLKVVSAAKVVHDEDQQTIIFRIRFRQLPGMALSNLKKASNEMKTVFRESLKDPKDASTKTLKRLISKGVDVKYEYYYPNNKLITAIKITHLSL